VIPYLFLPAGNSAMQDFKLNKLYIFRKYMNKNQRVIDFQLKLGTLVHEVLHGLPADVQNV